MSVHLMVIGKHAPAELGRGTEDYVGWLGHAPQGLEGGTKVMGQVKLGIG